MARGSSKLGGRGRGREVIDETGPIPAWAGDGATTPAAPSPARNILPGEPFEPVTSAFPAQRSPEPAPFAVTAPAGWGFVPPPGAPGMPGIPAGVPGGMAGVPGMPGTAPEPGLFGGDAATLTWPGDESTGPIPVVPAAAPDPLDALQQYAGLPLGAAPAPDPTQLYQSSPLTNAAPPAGEGTTQTLTAPSASGSGFADGGIFTGGEPFDGIPAAQPFASQANGLPGAFAPQTPTAGYIPQSSLEPMDVTPGSAGLLGEVLPEDESEGGRSRGRRRAGGRRRNGARPDVTSESAPRNGSKRAVAVLGVVAVLGAAGYVGYSQLSGTDATVASPAPVTKPAPAAARYTLPGQLANLVQITPAQTKALTANYTQLAAKRSPNLPPAQIATAYHSQGSGAATVNVVVFRPGSTSAYNALLGSLSRPAAGSASVVATPVAPGAAGGTMMCGSQHGAQSAAWCAWNSSKGMGFVQAKGTANTAYAAVYTRELRAFAER